jgi:2-haloacid dehalogenase
MAITTAVFDAYGTLYDIQSVATVTEEAFPGHGDIITQLWRIKQLEYTWLRSLMNRYEDFSAVTRHSLAYTLRLLGLRCHDAVLDRIMGKYLDLDLYPGVRSTLEALKGYRLAILSNGSPDMLDALTRNTSLDQLLEATISVDRAKTFKPRPEAYALIQSGLGVNPSEVMFVSSNPWDVAGAKSAGLNVTWIERVPPQDMAQALQHSELVPPLTMFKAIRMQMDELGFEPDHRIREFSALAGILQPAA